jgi:antitoxin HigA-1
MARQNFVIWQRHPAASRRCTEIEKGSTAYESMINGACVSFGGMGTHMKLKLRIITEETMTKSQKLLSPIHPGEILRAEFMQPLGLSMNRLALDLRVPVTRIAEIVHERRAITPDTALRLARYFNTSAGFWLNLQTAYDLEVAQDKFSEAIEKEVRPVIASADGQS